ncbi:hypothetical protein E6C50_10390 [Flavobacterium supellecticarium]|uniref:Uncharacterized protein n=1 Tax=Flavobacterium supellecticarium TaxID=2565924 RepID=A0A4S3ZXK2_9FLAO|nr:hypothetical protein [Flavobacterium supellecticarium]THF50622.1 hypothetical protein E6C50_10390 [Flavobacterium supellecticarium]
MQELKFKISPGTIRKVNRMLIANNDVRSENVGNYKGVITVKTIIDGIVRIREISREEINEAYGKSLNE